MALVETSLPLEALLGQWGQLSPDAALTLRAPGMEPLQVPLEPPPGVPQELREVVVWEWSGVARDEGEMAAEWLTELLGKPVRLVRYVGKPTAGIGAAKTDPKRRPVDPDWAPEGHETAFTDAFPFLLANEASLADLNAHIGGEEPLKMNRFRPNIVLGGAAPWAEDDVAAFTLGGNEFSSVKPCDRCKVTTVCQETAAVGKEPLQTLGAFRSGAALDWTALPSWKHAVFFGWNLVTKSRGTVAIGDEQKVTRLRNAAAA